MTRGLAAQIPRPDPRGLPSSSNRAIGSSCCSNCANELPSCPALYGSSRPPPERVVECQSPVSIFVEVDENRIVHLHATAPEEHRRPAASRRFSPRGSRGSR
jgi:hypothetical protein